MRISATPRKAAAMAATTAMSELYWLPWLHVYQDLQEAAHDACALPRLEAQLKATQRWLLGGSGRHPHECVAHQSCPCNRTPTAGKRQPA
jgi:hypothetical protein